MVRLIHNAMFLAAGLTLGCGSDSDQAKVDKPAGEQAGSAAAHVAALADEVAAVKLNKDEFLVRLASAGDLIRHAQRDNRAQRQLASWLPGDAAERLAAALDQRVVVVAVDRSRPAEVAEAPRAIVVSTSVPPADSQPAKEAAPPAEQEAPATQPAEEAPAPPVAAWEFADIRVPRVSLVGKADDVIPAAELGNNLGDLRYSLHVEALGPAAVRDEPAGGQSKSFYLDWQLTVKAKGLTLDGVRLPDEPTFTFGWKERFSLAAQSPSPADTNAPPAQP